MDFAALSINELKALNPDLLLVPLVHANNPKVGDELTSRLSALLGRPLRVSAFAPHTLTLIYRMFEQLTEDCGVGAKGRTLVQRVTAQGMDWGDNFYERTKNKRVTMLSSVMPLRLAGMWFPDLIHLASALAQENVAGVPHREVTWEEILAFKPDVIIVAPEGYSLKETMQTFKILEKQPAWESIPAVKRGEVIFLEGKAALYNPTQRLTDALAYIFSAIAGFEAGYITPRESFYRLRWIELQRHRLD